MSDKEMKEWTKICQAFCDRNDAELLFVKEGHFGCQFSSGQFGHIYADELTELFK